MVFFTPIHFVDNSVTDQSFVTNQPVWLWAPELQYLECCVIIHLLCIEDFKINIFVLDQNPFDAARYHCDKHVVKMIVEYAQLLSTAHRFHDAVRKRIDLPNGKSKVVLLMPGETVAIVAREIRGKPSYKATIANPVCYAATHANHPSAVWARATDANYHWLYQLFLGCLHEYEKRYERQHGTSRLSEFLSRAPKHITRSQMTPFALAMPEEYKHEDPVEAYRRFYVGAKARFAKWKNTPAPDWFKHHMERQDATDF